MSVFKKVPFAVTASTLYAAVYQILIIVDSDIRIILALFAFSPFVLCYMAYVILKYGEPSTSTFEEKFYEDSEIRRS